MQSTCSWAQSKYLKYLEEAGGNHGWEAAETGGDQTSGIEYRQNTGVDAKWIRETLLATGNNIIQNTVNTLSIHVKSGPKKM